MINKHYRELGTPDEAREPERAGFNADQTKNENKQLVLNTRLWSNFILCKAPAPKRVGPMP